MKQTYDTQAQIWCKKCNTLHAVNAPCPLPVETPDTPTTEIAAETTAAKPIFVECSPTPVQKETEPVEIQKKAVSNAPISTPTDVPTSVPTAAQEDLNLVIVEVPVQLLTENASVISFSPSKTVSAIFANTEVSIGSQSYPYSKILYISMPLITSQGHGEILLNYSGVVYTLLFSKKDFAKMQIASVYTAEKIGQPTSSAEARFVDANTQSETDSTYQINCREGRLLEIKQLGIHDEDSFYPYAEVLYITPPFYIQDGSGKILVNHSGTVLSFIFDHTDFAKMQVAVFYAQQRLQEYSVSQPPQSKQPNQQAVEKPVSPATATASVKDIESKQTVISSGHVCPYCNQKIHKNAVICVHCGTDLKNAEFGSTQSTPTVSLTSCEKPERTSDSATPDEAKEDTSSFNEALLIGDSAESPKSDSFLDSQPKPQSKAMSAKARIANGVFHCIMPIVWLAAPVFYLDAHYGYSPELALRILLGDTTLPNDRYVPWEFAFEDIPSSIIFYILLVALIIGHIMCAISIFKRNNSKVFKIVQPLPLLCSAITLICIQTEAYYLFNGTLNDFITLRTTPFAWLLVVIEIALLVFTVQTKREAVLQNN